MPELGTVDRDFFDEYIYPNLGADRDDVTLGPQHGVDFGAVEVDAAAVAMATDPIFVIPRWASSAPRGSPSTSSCRT